MISKLYLVEGIPGAGKTTMAQKLKLELESKGEKVILYEEGDSHPADMAWNAYLTYEDYDEFIKQCQRVWKKSEKTVAFEELLMKIEGKARHEDDHVILAYTKIDFPEAIYWENIDLVADKEICDGRTSLADFKEIHLRRWKKFKEEALKSESIYIFECAFLQNHIFELMSVYEKSDEEIVKYLRDLIETVQELHPTIFYIRPSDIEKVIEHAARERKALDETCRDWIDEIAEWVSRSKFGISHHLHGKSGVISFCRERYRLDLLALKSLNIPVKIIERY